MGHGSWQYYKFYGPYANEFASEETQDSPKDQVACLLKLSSHLYQPMNIIIIIIIKTITRKVLSPSNKRDFTVFTLRDVPEEDLETPDSLKEVIIAQVGDAVSSKTKFPLG